MAILSYTKADGTVVKLNSYKVNNVLVKQEKGQSTAAVMSQKAVTDELASVGLQIDEVTGTISTLSQTVNTKANASEVYTKTESDNKYLTAADITGKADKSEVSALSTKVDKNTADLATEVSRATAKENELTTSISDEVTRATTAEGTLTTSINDEVTRATTAENTLTDNLAAEVTRATEAEEANAAEIAEIKAIRVINCGTY